MALRLLELSITLASLIALLAALVLIRRRDRLLAQVRGLAALLAERDETNAPRFPGTLRGLSSALDQIGQRLTALRTSEQGRLQQALRLSEAVLEAMPDPVVVFNGEASVMLFNSAARSLFGERLRVGSAAAMLGDPILQLAAEEASLGFPMASTQVPHISLLQHDVKRRFRLRALPLPTGSAAGAVVVLQDVTDSDAEVDRLRQAGQSALFELRPLVDALGAELLGAARDRPGIDEWQAIDAVIRDVEGATVAQAPERMDLADLVDGALDAVALEAQRLRVKVQREVERPTPAVLTEVLASRRLLLRALRGGLRRCSAGDVMTVEIRRLPRPSVRITPAAIPVPLDEALLDRAQIVARNEATTAKGPAATVFQFAQTVD